MRPQPKPKLGPAEDLTSRASALLARGAGSLSMMLVRKRLSRAQAREAAVWARQAADLLDRVAGSE